MNSYIFFSYLTDDGTLLLGGGSALYRLDGDRIVRIGADQQTSQVTFFHKMRDGSLLIGGQTGVFRREGDTLVRLTDLNQTGRIFQFLVVRDDTLLIAAQHGVFRLNGGNFARLGEFGHMRKTAENAVVVGNRHGLLRLDGDRLLPVGTAQDTGWIGWMQPTKIGLLVFTQHGMFLLAGEQLERIDGGERVGSMEQPVAVHELADGALLIGAEKGLFRLAPCP